MATALPSMACLADDTKCRASRRLLELGNPLESARAAIADKKELRIVAMGWSSTQGYGASNPAFAYPAQLKMDLDKLLPGVDVHVFNKGIGGQDTRGDDRAHEGRRQARARADRGLAGRHQLRDPPHALGSFAAKLRAASMAAALSGRSSS